MVGCRVQGFRIVGFRRAFISLSGSLINPKHPAVSTGACPPHLFLPVFLRHAQGTPASGIRSERLEPA